MNARASARGGILLEVIVALAILLMSVMTVSGIVIDSLNSMIHTRQTMQACDLARSTMAQIEAGLVDPTAVNGPAVRWDSSRLLMPEDTGVDEPPDLSEDEPAPAGMTGPMSNSVIGAEDDADGLWSLEVETEPTGTTGLWLVSVTARLSPVAAPDAFLASYTLRQVVRLSSEVEDVAGEEDDLMDAARRGLRGSGR